MTVRTRFAPSPTGFLHIGGARTALFSWAYARRHGGTFILRIEDTDVARSTPEAVQAILDGMQWLGLAHDEGPFYQMQRMDRYRQVIAEMLDAGTAYRCYMSREELDALRAEQEARKEKPRYDGRWRPEAGKTLPAPPPGVAPAIRFRNPKDGVVGWQDQVKGRIEFANGCVANLTASRTSTASLRRLRVFQHHEYISVDFGDRRIGISRRRDAPVEGEEPIDTETVQQAPGDALMTEITAFVAAVRDGTPPVVSGREGRDALAVALEIDRMIAARQISHSREPQP